jgi:hypothetical protein
MRCCYLSKSRESVDRLTLRGRFETWLSGVQLIQQGLGLLQIERVKAFGEPAIDWASAKWAFRVNSNSKGDIRGDIRKSRLAFKQTQSVSYMISVAERKGFEPLIRL